MYHSSANNLSLIYNIDTFQAKPILLDKSNLWTIDLPTIYENWLYPLELILKGTYFASINYE